MKRRLFAVLLAFLMMIGVTAVPAAAYNENEELIRQILHSPGLKPGDLLAAGAQGGYRYGYGYDFAEVVLTSSVTNPAGIDTVTREFVIVGDLFEFNDDAVILYEDGTTVKGIKEIFNDGERITFHIDPLKHAVFKEMFVSWRAVRGSQYSAIYHLINSRYVGSAHYDIDIPQNVKWFADSPYPITRPPSSRSIGDVVYQDEAGGVHSIPDALPPGGTSEPINSPTLPVANFIDVPATHWARSNIISAYDKGLMVGVEAKPNGNIRFDPEGTLTKAQVAQIAYNAYSEEQFGSKTAEFEDVAIDAWYHEAVIWLVGNGFAELDNGRFYPNIPAPRWFIVDVLCRIAQVEDADMPTTTPPVSFPDVIGEYAKYSEDIAVLQRAGIISGFPDGTFGPEKSLTRAQMAKLIDLFTGIPGLAPSKK